MKLIGHKIINSGDALSYSDYEESTSHIQKIAPIRSKKKARKVLRAGNLIYPGLSKYSLKQIFEKLQ